MKIKDQTDSNKLFDEYLEKLMEKVLNKENESKEEQKKFPDFKRDTNSLWDLRE